MTETLFSLEIHVESVENLRVACKLPALCFRLLDFPTMIIHHVSPVDAEKMRQRLRLEDKETLLHELKDRFGNFQFRKGKSCLFKASIDTLLVQLQTVPLYAMLMDLWPRKPALVGSTLIPLKKAIDKISTDVYKKGVAVPSFYRDEGEFNVYNLMGTCITKVKLGFRLLSLGGSLIPHIPTEALAGKINKIATGGKVEQAVKGALEKVLPEIESRNLFEEEIAEENTESKTDGEKVTSPQRRDIKHNVQVQTNLHARDIKSPELLNHSGKESEEDVVITNTFCPPPLYYNYFSNSAPCNGSNSGKMGEPVPQRSGNSNVTSNAHTVKREANRQDVDFMCYDPGLVQPDGTVGLASVSVQTDRTLPKPSVRLESSGDQAGLINGLYNLRGLTSDGRLPILNALLQELSCLTGGQQIMDTNQSSGRPQATPGHPPKASGKRLDSQATRKPLTAVKSRTRERQTQQAPPPKRTQSSVIGLSSRRVRFKQTNLTYGMTKTQKMRLELNQKDKLPNRTRPCEAQAVLAQKESIKRDSLRTPLSEGGLGMTYKIGSAKRQMGREMKQTADAQIQTQPSLSDHELEQLPCNNGGILPSTTDVKEEVAKPDDVCVHSAIESARSVQSPNSLEVFIPQVEGNRCTYSSYMYLFLLTFLLFTFYFILFSCCDVLKFIFITILI